MPHVFSMVLAKHPCSPFSYQSLGRFIKAQLSKSAYEYKRVKIHPKTLQEEKLADEELGLGGLTMERLVEMMGEEVGRWKRKIREVEEEMERGVGEWDVEGAKAAAGAAAKL